MKVKKIQKIKKKIILIKWIFEYLTLRVINMKMIVDGGICM